jgi:hypothetical protein
VLVPFPPGRSQPPEPAERTATIPA